MMRPLAYTAGSLLAVVSMSGCHYDRGDRWDDVGFEQPRPQQLCTVGARRCTSRLEECRSDLVGGTTWYTIDDCGARGMVCASALLACTFCQPNERSCDGQTVVVCDAQGQTRTATETCDEPAGRPCRSGACINLCEHASRTRSNVGCEYWGVDLDNAMINATNNAAAQQYAIVVSNPHSDVAARVIIEQDDALPSEPARVTLAAQDIVPPNNLRVFRLGPREVDGSPEGEYDTGPGTALTRHAYRIKSHVPVVAYQFNPLDNVAVFSNDASLLKPVEAVTYTPGKMQLAYLVSGWPQTIAHTNDPETNFNPVNPIDLRAFTTLVATRPNTRVRFTTTTRIIPGNDIAEQHPGDTLELTMQPFEVLNLETGGFNADFTGSTIEADQPLVVFTGGEASDAPYFARLADRFCCADHLEEQLDPIRTAGRSFIGAHAPNRTRAVRAAGGPLAEVPEPEYFRIVATSAEGHTTITTTLPPPDDHIVLGTQGDYRDVTAYNHFLLDADRPVLLTSIQASQDAAGVRRGLPGGDPSLIVVPPREQYRADYVFLTPDKYAFDFIVIAAMADAVVLLDGMRVDENPHCTMAPADGLNDEQRGGPATVVVYECQLSFPVIHPDLVAPNNVRPGEQNDGVHRVESDQHVMVLVYGFDHYVSYGYAAGTQLEEIAVH